jgi:mono/diheme cytochrome c family protein
LRRENDGEGSGEATTKHEGEGMIVNCKLKTANCRLEDGPHCRASSNLQSPISNSQFTIFPLSLRRPLPPLLLLLLFATGCRQQMSTQAYYRPLEASNFFDNGASARLPVPGTVARGELHEDPRFYEGKTVATGEGLNMAAMVGPGGAAPIMPTPEQIARLPFVTELPVTVDEKLLRNGQTRYTTYCAVCHGNYGEGNGVVVQRGFTAPPTLHSQRLRDAPAGYFFDIITYGLGSMPDYSGMIPPGDRWAIVAYVRALQLSGHARLDNLLPEVRDRVRAKLEGRRER